MRSFTRRVLVLLVAVGLVTGAPAAGAEPDICVSIDEIRDTLSPDERAASLLLIARQFERAGERVVPECPATYTLAHVRLGSTIIVTLAGPRGVREGRALGLDDLPALYSQMVRSLVIGQSMTALGIVRSDQRDGCAGNGAPDPRR
jgi:hypothetical protein